MGVMIGQKGVYRSGVFKGYEKHFIAVRHSFHLQFFRCIAIVTCIVAAYPFAFWDKGHSRVVDPSSSAPCRRLHWECATFFGTLAFVLVFIHPLRVPLPAVTDAD